MVTLEAGSKEYEEVEALILWSTKTTRRTWATQNIVIGIYQ